RLMQGHEAIVQAPYLDHIRLLPGLVQTRAKPWRYVRGYGNAPVAALGEEGHHRRVLAGELIELLSALLARATGPHEVGRCVLYTDDPRQLRQAPHGLRSHIDDRASGDIVDEDRDIDGVVDRPVML